MRSRISARRSRAGFRLGPGRAALTDSLSSVPFLRRSCPAHCNYVPHYCHAFLSSVTIFLRCHLPAPVSRCPRSLGCRCGSPILAAVNHCDSKEGMLQICTGSGSGYVAAGYVRCTGANLCCCTYPSPIFSHPSLHPFALMRFPFHVTATGYTLYRGRLNNPRCSLCSTSTIHIRL
jgi:hypothetical protein